MQCFLTCPMLFVSTGEAILLWKQNQSWRLQVWGDDSGQQSKHWNTSLARDFKNALNISIHGKGWRFLSSCGYVRKPSSAAAPEPLQGLPLCWLTDPAPALFHSSAAHARVELFALCAFLLVFFSSGHLLHKWVLVYSLWICLLKLCTAVRSTFW